MEGEGMVAVVRGLRDTALAVTLLDGTRQYTLTPNYNGVLPPVPQVTGNQCSTATSPTVPAQPSPAAKTTIDSSTDPSRPHCESSTQAVDGRYASMYKTMYCHVQPTAPPVQLTEFPPQRPDICRGHGNFQVGGTGSGVRHTSVKVTPNNYRGGLCWPDRGSVCSPRPSYEADAFANSLRKYPNLDRSSEVMERLINYTHTSKGVSKTSTRNQSSPNRLTEPSSHHTIDSKVTTRIARPYEPEIIIKTRKPEEPTRDRKKEDYRELRSSKGYEVRCLRDMSKKLRDNVKAISTYPYSQAHSMSPSPSHRDKYDNQGNNYGNTSSVNMEIQTAVKMISKEVATVHRDQPPRKTVAVPDTISAGERNSEGEFYYVPNLDTNISYKSIQTTLSSSESTLKPKKSAQTVCSNIEFYSKRKSNRPVERFRKSKSQEQIKVTKEDLRRSLLQLIEDVSTSKKSKKFIRDELIKKLFETDKGSRDDRKRENSKIKPDKCHDYVSTFCRSGCDYIDDFKEMVMKLKNCYGDTRQSMRTEIKPLKISEYKQLDFVLKDWINDLNIQPKSKDGQCIDRNEILNSIEEKIKGLFKYRTKHELDYKTEIVKIIENVPIEFNSSYSKKSYLHRLVDVLLKRMKNVVISQRMGKTRRKASAYRSRRILTAEDIRDFLKGNLFDVYDECHLEISDNVMDQVENELLDILIDSIDCIRCGHIDDARDDMESILQDIGKMNSKQADYTTNIILLDFREMLNNCNFNKTFMILHNEISAKTYPNNVYNRDLNIGDIDEEDVNANLEYYTNQLCIKINEWLDSLDIPQIHDKGFRDVVINDLAADIVDRLKYLELNSSVIGTDRDELETLKYQIFKWINKLVGDENTETIAHAQDLMDKIKSVHIPLLNVPQNNKIDAYNLKTSDNLYDLMRPCLGESGPDTCRKEKGCCGTRVCTNLENDPMRPCMNEPGPGVCKKRVCCGKPACINTPFETAAAVQPSGSGKCCATGVCAAEDDVIDPMKPCLNEPGPGACKKPICCGKPACINTPHEIDPPSKGCCGTRVCPGADDKVFDPMRPCLNETGPGTCNNRRVCCGKPACVNTPRETKEEQLETPSTAQSSQTPDEKSSQVGPSHVSQPRNRLTDSHTAQTIPEYQEPQIPAGLPYQTVPEEYLYPDELGYYPDTGDLTQGPPGMYAQPQEFQEPQGPYGPEFTFDQGSHALPEYDQDQSFVPYAQDVPQFQEPFTEGFEGVPGDVIPQDIGQSFSPSQFGPGVQDIPASQVSPSEKQTMGLPAPYIPVSSQLEPYNEGFKGVPGGFIPESGDQNLGPIPMPYPTESPQSQAMQDVNVPIDFLPKIEDQIFQPATLPYSPDRPQIQEPLSQAIPSTPDNISQRQDQILSTAPMPSGQEFSQPQTPFGQAVQETPLGAIPQSQDQSYARASPVDHRTSMPYGQSTLPYTSERSQPQEPLSRTVPSALDKTSQRQDQILSPASMPYDQELSQPQAPFGQDIQETPLGPTQQDQSYARPEDHRTSVPYGQSKVQPQKPIGQVYQDEDSVSQPEHPSLRRTSVPYSQDGQRTKGLSGQGFEDTYDDFVPHMEGPHRSSMPYSQEKRQSKGPVSFQGAQDDSVPQIEEPRRISMPYAQDGAQTKGPTVEDFQDFRVPQMEDPKIPRFSVPYSQNRGPLERPIDQGFQETLDDSFPQKESPRHTSVPYGQDRRQSKGPAGQGFQETVDGSVPQAESQRRVSMPYSQDRQQPRATGQSFQETFDDSFSKIESPRRTSAPYSQDRRQSERPTGQGFQETLDGSVPQTEGPRRVSVRYSQDTRQGPIDQDFQDILDESVPQTEGPRRSSMLYGQDRRQSTGRAGQGFQETLDGSVSQAESPRRVSMPYSQDRQQSERPTSQGFQKSFDDSFSQIESPRRTSVPYGQDRRQSKGPTGQGFQETLDGSVPQTEGPRRVSMPYSQDTRQGPIDQDFQDILDESVPQMEGPRRSSMPYSQDRGQAKRSTGQGFQETFDGPVPQTEGPRRVSMPYSQDRQQPRPTGKGFQETLHDSFPEMESPRRTSVPYSQDRRQSQGPIDQGIRDDSIPQTEDPNLRRVSVPYGQDKRSSKIPVRQAAGYQDMPETFAPQSEDQSDRYVSVPYEQPHRQSRGPVIQGFQEIPDDSFQTYEDQSQGPAPSAVDKALQESKGSAAKSLTSGGSTRQDEDQRRLHRASVPYSAPKRVSIAPIGQDLQGDINGTEISLDDSVAHDEDQYASRPSAPDGQSKRQSIGPIPQDNTDYTTPQDDERKQRLAPTSEADQAQRMSKGPAILDEDQRKRRTSESSSQEKKISKAPNEKEGEKDETRKKTAEDEEDDKSLGSNSDAVGKKSKGPTKKRDEEKSERRASVRKEETGKIMKEDVEDKTSEDEEKDESKGLTSEEKTREKKKSKVATGKDKKDEKPARASITKSKEPIKGKKDIQIEEKGRALGPDIDQIRRQSKGTAGQGLEAILGDSVGQHEDRRASVPYVETWQGLQGDIEDKDYIMDQTQRQSIGPTGQGPDSGRPDLRRDSVPYDQAMQPSTGPFTQGYQGDYDNAVPQNEDNTSSPAFEAMSQARRQSKGPVRQGISGDTIPQDITDQSKRRPFAPRSLAEEQVKGPTAQTFPDVTEYTTLPDQSLAPVSVTKSHEPKRPIDQGFQGDADFINPQYEKDESRPVFEVSSQGQQQAVRPAGRAVPGDSLRQTEDPSVGYTPVAKTPARRQWKEPIGQDFQLGDAIPQSKDEGLKSTPYDQARRHWKSPIEQGFQGAVSDQGRGFQPSTPATTGPFAGPTLGSPQLEDPNQQKSKIVSFVPRPARPDVTGTISPMPMYDTMSGQRSISPMSSPQAVYMAGPKITMRVPPGGRISYDGGTPEQMIGNVNAMGAGTADSSYYMTSQRRPSTERGSLPPGTCCITASTCCPNAGGSPQSLKQLNDEYDEYLKQWVQQIPITANTPEEQELAEKARLGIYNGIWKAITKLKLDDKIFSNPLYYQDALDDEIEELLGLLPESPELETQKQKLKSQLLEKTKDMNKIIISTHAPASFKQQLIENIENNMPKKPKNINVDAPALQDEAVKKQKVAEDYILYLRYKKEDSAKANVHKENYLKNLNEYLNTVKSNCCKDVDVSAKTNEIKNALEKVPVPNMDFIRDEADDILIGKEVENWISDLPQKPDANFGPLEKRRVRDALVMKIKELGTVVGFGDCSFARPLKNELPKILEKIPIKDGTNIDFMLEELANRIKKISPDLGQKTIIPFEDSDDYEMFRTNVPAFSSMLEPHVPDQSQWSSIQQTQIPSDLVNWTTIDQNMHQFDLCCDRPDCLHRKRGYIAHNYGQAVPPSPGDSGYSGSHLPTQSSAAHTSYIPQGPSDERFPQYQKSPGPYSQEQGFEPSQAPYGRMSPVPGATYDPDFIQHQSFGPVSPGQMTSRTVPQGAFEQGPQTPQRAFGRHSQGAYDQLPQGAYGQTPQGISEYSPRGMYGQVPQGIFDQTPSGVYARLPRGAYGQTPEGTPGHDVTRQLRPLGAFDQVPRGTHDQVPRGMYGQVPQGTLDQDPRRSCDVIPIQVLGQIPQGEISQGPPGRQISPSPYQFPQGTDRQTPQGAYGQGPRGAYSQGPTGAYSQGSPGAYSQGPPGAYSQGPPGAYGQSRQGPDGRLILQGTPSPGAARQVPQGSYGQVPQGAYSHLPSQGPYRQVLPQGPHGQVPQRAYGQDPQGDHSQYLRGPRDQTPQGTYGQVSQMPYGQAPSQGGRGQVLPQGARGQVPQGLYGQPPVPPLQGAFRQIPQGAPGQISQGAPGQISQDTPGQTSQGAYGQAPARGITGQVPQGAPGQIPQRAVGQIAQGSYGQAPPRGATGQIPQRVLEQISQGTYGQAPPQGAYGQGPPQGAYGQAPSQGVTGQISQGAYGQVPPQGAPGQVSHGAYGQVSPQGVRGQVLPQGFRGQVPSGAYGQALPQGIPGQITQGAPSQVPQGAYGQVSPQAASGQVPQGAYRQMPTPPILGSPGWTSPEPTLSRCNRGTTSKGHPTEIKTTQKKPRNEKLTHNIKSVQTAFSSIDIETTKCKYCEIRSKSQEELTKITKKQEIITRRDLGKGDLQRDVTEWFEIHSDKVKVKLCREKIQKLAQELKKPGGEEKLRMKIEKYLKKVPDQFADGDDDKGEFRKHLPDDIIKKLKKMNLHPSDANLNVYRMELFKYCSRFKMDNFKRAIMNWLKSLHLKKKDFLGRNVKKDDVFNFVADTLEPLVLDRPKSDTEYKKALKSNITEIIDELPIILGSHNKEFYVNKVAETLVNDILSIENSVPTTYIQPTMKEVKEFIKDEITFFLEKARIAISTKRMECLETELMDVLSDLQDVLDVDNYVVEEISNILKGIGKLPEYKAKYFTSVLLKDYKEFFFRQSFFQEKSKPNCIQPDLCSVIQNAVTVSDPSCIEIYTQQLIDEISCWWSETNISAKDKNFKDMAVKNLANEITDRYKYLLSNLKINGSEAEELEHLKYQIFKWINKLVGKNSAKAIEHTKYLMERINNIPKPPLLNTANKEFLPNTDVIADSKLFIDKLTTDIYNWVQEIPINLYASQDVSVNKQVIKELAQDIENSLINNDMDLMNKKLYNWSKKFFKIKLHDCDIEQLKVRIKSALNTKGNTHTEENIDRNPKQEKLLIRSYEDIIDEWVDTVPVEPKKECLFIQNRNEIIHELAVKICKVKTNLIQSPDEVIEKKLQEEISIWMKKLPLNLQTDTNRDKYAVKLAKCIQECNVDDSIELNLMENDKQFESSRIESIIMEWLKGLQLYNNKSVQDKLKQEAIMKELAKQLSGDRYQNSESDEIIIKHIRLLDPNQKANAIQNMALQLKSCLQQLEENTEVVSQHDDSETVFNTNIEGWIKDLPLDIKDVNRFNNQKKDFIESMNRLNDSGVNGGVIKKEIITFIKTLPIESSKRSNPKFLEHEASKLMLNSGIAYTENLPKDVQPKMCGIINGAIKDWAKNLPLKPVYCPRELRSFIDDMSQVITSLIIHPEYTTIEENDKRLHREIVKFLKRFPLQQEVSTENHISRTAEELVKSLKDIHSICHASMGDDKLRNITVCDVSLENPDLNCGFRNTVDYNGSSDAYTRKLVHQITEWFSNLNFRNIQEESFKEIVINDLAGDIVDRHKYLELNPESRGTDEDELEHLKYQIFKWINKLVGDENMKTIDNAIDLMHRIQRIPVPMLVRPQDKCKKRRHSCSQQKNPSRSTSPWQDVNSHFSVGSFAESVEVATTCCPLRNENQPPEDKQKKYSRSTSPWRDINSSFSGRSFGKPIKVPEITCCPLRNESPSPEDKPVLWQEENELSAIDPPSDKDTQVDVGQPQNAKKTSSPPATIATSTPNVSPDHSSLSPSSTQTSTKEAIYEKYQKIFRQKCDTLPLESSTAEGSQLADLAKTSIYNGIIKTFFKLKSDPEIENDYGYFEFLLEEKIEEMLDVLPQTSELLNTRHAWKIEIIANAIDMLDELHSLSDRSSFRQRVRNKFNRKFARDQELEQCFLLQQRFLAEMANAYILETKYKEDDPIKAKIYKHRLMNKIDNLANHLSKEHNVGFRFFKKPQLARIAMKVLEQVPIPTDDVLQEEAEEIELADKIEKWYKSLPTKPIVDDTDEVLRKRMMDLLAKKLYDIEKHIPDGDPSKEAQMKHDVSQFLETRAKLQDDADLNINLMVDQLIDRLKNKTLKEPENYDEFLSDMPFSSTFAQVNNNELLPSAMDAATSTAPIRLPGHEQSCQVGATNNFISQQGSPIGLAMDMNQMGPIPGCCQATLRGAEQVNLQPNLPTPQVFPQQAAPLYNTYPGHFSYGPGLATTPETTYNASQFGPNLGYMPQGAMLEPHLQPSPPEQSQMQRPEEMVPVQSRHKRCLCGTGRHHSSANHGYGKQPLQEITPSSCKTKSSCQHGNKNSTRVPNNNQYPDQRLCNLQSLGGVGQPVYDQSLMNPYGAQNPQRPSPNIVPGLMINQSPIHSFGTTSTGQTGSGTSDERLKEYMSSDYMLKCRCLEAYQKRKQLLKDAEDRCLRYKPYKH